MERPAVHRTIENVLQTVSTRFNVCLQLLDSRLCTFSYFESRQLSGRVPRSSCNDVGGRRREIR